MVTQGVLSVSGHEVTVDLISSPAYFARDISPAEFDNPSMLNNSADSRIREVKPLPRSGRKFRAQNEIDESVAELTFEEVRGPTQTDRHAVGWNHQE